MFSEKNMREMIMLTTIMLNLLENISPESTNKKLNKSFSRISYLKRFLSTKLHTCLNKPAVELNTSQK